MNESSIVAFAVSVAGILTTYLTARMALRTDIERATILRFVEMFETAIQGLTVCIDHCAYQLALYGTPVSEQNLSLRIKSFLNFHQIYSGTAKVADSAMLKLRIYFPDQKHESFELRESAAVAMALSEWIVKTDQRMQAEMRMVATDGELSEYCHLESRLVESLKETQSFLASRRDYFIRCYATWRKMNLLYIKNICPSAN